MRIFAGKKRAQKILLKLQKKIAKKRISPVLAVISVGRNPASELFIKNKKQAAENIGVRVDHFRFKEGVLAKKIIEKINYLNENKEVHGIIVQLPLPGKLDAGKVVGVIDPLKDVDGFGLRTKFSPPLASAIFLALKSSVKNLSDKKIVALVNSDFLGQSLRKFLRKKKIKIGYLLRNKDWQVKMKGADIVITVCGCPGLIKGECVKEKAALIDAGIVVLKNKKVAGDVDRISIENIASFLTPVPGGLGPLTVAYLLENVYLSAEKTYGLGN
jgi:methylenetetrahydrofolate dehydrogenase (NADP+)/methenyltetrahydrofolate cyclohydrolase